jgi:predicted alpha/beta hydrolase
MATPETTTPAAPNGPAPAGNGANGRNGNGNGAAPRADRPGPLEWRTYLTAAVAIIVYLVLAYFAFIRVGAHRADHVLAVIVPSAILALTAELYSRTPAWLRASLSLLFGVLALVSGLVAMDRLRLEGMSAGGLVGILPLVAGAALLVLGVRTAWHYRRRGGPRWRTVLRRGLIAVAALFVLYWLVLPVSLAIIATERPARPTTDADLGRPKQDVTLVTRDGVKLSAWYVPSRNHAAIVTFPRETTIPQARMLVRNGYGVLLVDPRGYGDSEGDPNAYGWGSTKDIDAAVAWLRRRPDVQKRRIGGLGLSMGGEQMLEAAARNPGLKAVVSEGAGIRSVREAALEKSMSPLARVLTYPQCLVQTVSVWLLGGDTVPMSLKSAAILVGPRPVFFIYAGDGQEAEKTVNPVYYRSAFAPKAIWEVPGAGHTRGIQTQPKEYERLVVDFFNKALLDLTP